MSRARTARHARPSIMKQESLGRRSDTAYSSFGAMHGLFRAVSAWVPPAEQARQAALLRYYRDHDTDGTRTLWQQQSEPPRDPTELVMLADSEADAGSDAALAYIAELRQYEPGEADTILATLRIRQDRPDEAAAALEAALTRLRNDPWPTLQFKQRALQIAVALAEHDAVLARRMFEALRQPFSVRAVDDRRLITVAELTRQLDFGGLCGQALDALEPHVPWTESFLRLRRDCYQATSSPRLGAAARDLNEFLTNAGQALVP